MRTMRARATLAALVAAALGGAACGGAARSAEMDEAGGAVETAQPTITFRNESTVMATVYAVRDGGSAVRLETVSPGRTVTLRLTSGLLGAGQIRILAVPMAGGETVTTGPLTLVPGQDLVVTMPPSANILNVLPAP